MLFVNKHSISKSSLVGLSLAVALLTSACNQQPKATDTTTESKTEVEVAKTSDTATPAANEEVFVMTSLGLDSINNMILNPLVASDKVNAEQKSCLQARDKQLGQAELQAFYKEKFSAAELQELKDFYSSDVGKKMIEYGKQEIVLMTGVEVATPMAEPTAEEIAEIQAFAQSPTGIKYAKINNELGEGSAIAALDAPMNAEFKRCNVDLTMSELLQPPTVNPSSEAPAAPATAG